MTTTAADGVQQVGKKKIVGRTFAETFRKLGDRPWDRLLNFSAEVKLKSLPLVLQSNRMARSDIEIGALSFRMG